MICGFPPELLLMKLGLHAFRPTRGKRVPSEIAYCASRTSAAVEASKSLQECLHGLHLEVQLRSLTFTSIE